MRFMMLFLLVPLLVPALSFADKSHDQAMKQLTTFFGNMGARQKFASKNPAAAAAEGQLAKFPPATQKRIINIILKIVQRHGKDAKQFTAASGKSPQQVFNSFPADIKAEIRALAKELAKDPNLKPMR